MLTGLPCGGERQSLRSTRAWEACSRGKTGAYVPLREETRRSLVDRISRRKFGQSVSGMLVAGALSGSASSQVSIRKRPNILFICSDQHSGPMLMGGPGEVVPVRTPNLKRLASRGVHFKNTYCVSPVCTPARAALMTGRFASDVGSYCNSTPFEGQVPTWGNYLQQAGYLCWATGKLELTPKADLGFQQVHTSHGHFEHPDITSLFRRPMCYRVDERKNVNGKMEERGKHDQDVLDAGLGFLRNEAKSSGKPWAAYLGFTSPHPPFAAPQKYWDSYPPTRCACRMFPRDISRKCRSIFKSCANSR